MCHFGGCCHQLDQRLECNLGAYNFFHRYISHYGSGTASLNVTVAGSIVLHHFGLWAKYPERPRDGEKYIVEEARNAGVRDGEPLSLSEVDLEVRKERAEENRRAKEEAAAAMGAPLTATSLLGGAATEGDGNW